MGIFDALFGNRKIKQNVDGFFQLLNGYTSTFTTWKGGVYESELCRTAIETIARSVGKLDPKITGSAKPELRTKLKVAPNPYQTWNDFLKRTATILYVNNTAFVVPLLGEFGQTTGIYAIAPERWELVRVKNEPWIRFFFKSGSTTAFKLSEIGILTRFQYESDLFGENNSALFDTMELINIQRQGIEEAARNSANFRFMAKLNNFSKSEDLRKERDRFNSDNLRSGGGGILLFPNTYADIKQVSQQTYAVDANQMHLIQQNVFNYFGVNEDVIQNKAYGDAWSAFYEGVIEAFAKQLSDVLTRMLFTDREIAFGSAFFLTSNRLQFVSDATKVQISTTMLDRGIFSINEVRLMWNLEPIEGGDMHPIRGEYYNLNDKTEETPMLTDKENEDGNEE